MLVAKSSSSFSPNHFWNTPPVLGKASIKDANDFAAKLQLRTLDASNPLVSSQNAFTACPRFVNFVFKPLKSRSPERKLPRPEIKSAAVIDTSASARLTAPPTTFWSIVRITTKKGVRFAANRDNDLPMDGIPLITPAEKAPIRLPTHSPIPVPILPRASRPLSKLSDKVLLDDSAPRASIMA